MADSIARNETAEEEELPIPQDNTSESDMTNSYLIALCPLDGRYASNSPLLQALRFCCSEFGLIRFRMRVEVEWLIALTEERIISELPQLTGATKNYLCSLWKDMTLSDAKCIKAFEQRTNHDVKSVEYFLKYKIAPLSSEKPPLPTSSSSTSSFSSPDASAAASASSRSADAIGPKQVFGSPSSVNTNSSADDDGRWEKYNSLSDNEKRALADCKEFVHFGCTSEDINNLAYGLMLKFALKGILSKAVGVLIDQIVQLALDNAAVPLLSRTHGQPASPTTFGKEMSNVAVRLQEHLSKGIKKTEIKGKFNGAVGNFNAHLAAYPHVNWNHVACRFVEESLGLKYEAYSTQIQNQDDIAEACDAVSRLNTTLVDLDADIWMYISRDILKLKVARDEVGSSTMPHKVNPIDFENSEGNLKMANFILRGLSAALPISRLQRDLSGSTMIRNLGIAIGYSLHGYHSTSKGLRKLTVNETTIFQELNANWAILAEPIQMILRKSNADAPYEALKAVTRGISVERQKAAIQSFLAALTETENCSPETKRKAEGGTEETLGDTFDVFAYCKKTKLSGTDKATLAQLTPHSYIGAADKMAKQLGEYLQQKENEWAEKK